MTDSLEPKNIPVDEKAKKYLGAIFGFEWRDNLDWASLTLVEEKEGTEVLGTRVYGPKDFIGDIKRYIHNFQENGHKISAAAQEILNSANIDWNDPPISNKGDMASQSSGTYNKSLSSNTLYIADHTPMRRAGADGESFFIEGKSIRDIADMGYARVALRNTQGMIRNI